MQFRHSSVVNHILSLPNHLFVIDGRQVDVKPATAKSATDTTQNQIYNTPLVNNTNNIAPLPIISPNNANNLHINGNNLSPRIPHGATEGRKIFVGGLSIKYRLI